MHPPVPARAAYGPISLTLHVLHFNGPGGCVVVIWVVGLLVLSAVVVVVVVVVVVEDDDVCVGVVSVVCGVVGTGVDSEPSSNSSSDRITFIDSWSTSSKFSSEISYEMTV